MSYNTLSADQGPFGALSRGGKTAAPGAARAARAARAAPGCSARAQGAEQRRRTKAQNK